MDMRKIGADYLAGEPVIMTTADSITDQAEEGNCPSAAIKNTMLTARNYQKDLLGRDERSRHCLYTL